MINLEDCGVDSVSRGIALGFDRVSKGSNAKILTVITPAYLFSNQQGVLRGTRKFSFYGRRENFKNRTTLKKILKNSKIHNF